MSPSVRGGEGALERILIEARSLSGYDLGETVRGLARKLGREPSEILKLNQNENFFVPIDFLRGLLREAVEEADPRLYPTDEMMDLREALGGRLKVSSEEIVIGTGCDQLIDLVSRMTLGRGDVAISIAPTFSMYEYSVRVQRSDYMAIPLKDDFSLDVEKMLDSATPRTRLLFLCSPNNPTANQFDEEEIKHLAEGFRGLVIVDETYVDFAEDSIVPLIQEFENLVVLGTFSKAFGLAGLRLGYAVANRDLATAMMKRFQLPYSVSAIALRLGLKLLENVEVIESTFGTLKEERSRLIGSLNEVGGVHALDSDTNFVLFQVVMSSDETYRALLKRGVIVRNIGRVLHMEDCLRVVVAPSPMSGRFITALREVLGE
ncbi:MAG: histidinol-phosphate transaminase [Candidatus Bathyarchaeota archaeon]|nr:histidinol-phosphate transaminase [Candidatus Bathyarchaeota archaeon]